MKATREGMGEWEIAAHLTFETSRQGAQHLSFPPVVAGGTNALIIHYTANDAVLKYAFQHRITGIPFTL